MRHFCQEHGRDKIPWFQCRARDMIVAEFTCNLKTLDRLKHALSNLVESIGSDGGGGQDSDCDAQPA